jgi:phosphoribosylglycinamide formyltransferase-1
VSPGEALSAKGSRARPTITVLVSGRGSNLAALLDTPDLGGEIVRVVSNRADAGGLAIASSHGVATSVVDHRAFGSRQDFDDALAAVIDADAPDLVVLAGFMRVLGAAFIGRYDGRMINIHPSLLPAYPGLHTHRRALADGVRLHGCTVHFVTPEVDVGPIVAQGAVPVRDGDDEEALAARVLAVEHILLPRVVRWYCEGRLAIEGRRVHVRGLETPGGETLVSPGP